MGPSQYFPSVLMYSETTVISVCQKRVPKVYREAFVTIETSLGRLKRPFFFLVGIHSGDQDDSEKQSETCSLALVTLGCMQTCFRVPFICLWIGRPGSPVRKTSANVRECVGLSRRLLKCVRRTTVHPNPVDPPIYVTDSEDVSFSAMTYVPAVYPVSDPLPPPPAPTSMPLPPAAFLSTDSAMLTLPPLTIPAQPPVYTIPLPTIPPVVFAQAPAPTADHFSFQAPQPQMNFPFQAPPPLNIPPIEPCMPTHAAPTAPPINIPPENEQERRMKRMEETIRALQAGTSRLDYGDFNWNLLPGMRLPSKIKIPDFKRYDGTKDPRHHLRHYQSKMLQY
ncbi:hypothetical protein CRG98_043630 [Punica granatum]|uniref:Extensin-like n=1 Tax=Punica granatum TaxID=22663 RepID=A0A2I0HWB8_PUNGR|nr:hypothetical protein CRG98_043630 [Punica granatum]